MTNNDIFKKLRVALMLRDDQIVEILELVDFRISKSEIGAFFRAENHENYVECGDQILRNFLNGLVIHLRGTKENPKNPNDVLAKHRAEIPVNSKTINSNQPKDHKDEKEIVSYRTRPSNTKPNTTKKAAPKSKKPAPKVQVVEKVKFNNGNKKKS
ncbi:DUF1456 family protein [Flavobacterium sp.]|uniref:DUF1456 family protein n=1 Tax=Flavobacterium sp. TaxID=239 RepID=UPI00286E888B|nr:DUF1456 family protein [Flavobacterium sp.]